ncbi:hypothetical protein HY632_01065 [Candidatus Uhrbacteria bacterium]|nr:hypothetical protein [Candidatus Uhrbacteria bacterium]
MDENVQVPDALIDRWLVPLDRLTQHPLGDLLRSTDGHCYRLPSDFQFPLACRDHAKEMRDLYFAQCQIVGYVMTALPCLVLPARPQDPILVDRAAFRMRIAEDSAPNIEAAGVNAARLDAMTATIDGLRYLAALIVSGKDSARLTDGRSIFGNAIFQLLLPGMEWIPFAESS